MTRRTMIPALAVALVVGGFATTSVAAPKKPVVKRFQASGKIPFPAQLDSCDRHPADSLDRHIERFRAPRAGKMTVEITGFLGDWDLALYDAKGRKVAAGDNAAATPTSMSDGSIVEKLVFRVRRAGDYFIHACNFAGGPNASGKITYLPS